MINDPVLGPYRADATHWSCWRMDRAGSQKGTRLLWDDGSGVETNEWPIETWKHEVVPERWGAGRYVVQFLR